MTPPPSPTPKKEALETAFLHLDHHYFGSEIQLIVHSNLPQTNVLIFIGNIIVRNKNLQFSKEAQIFGQSTHWPFSLF